MQLKEICSRYGERYFELLGEIRAGRLRARKVKSKRWEVTERDYTEWKEKQAFDSRRNVQQCRGCKYSGVLSSQHELICNYLEITGHMRGCPTYPECIKRKPRVETRKGAGKTMAKSILQDSKECVLTGYTGIYLDKHHIFGNANRDRSENMGLWVYVYKPLHNNSPESIHEDYQLNLMLKKWAQRLCMEHYDMTVEDFIRDFGKNYLLEDSDYEINPPFGREFCICEEE